MSFPSAGVLQTNLTYNGRDTDFTSVNANTNEGNEDWLLETTHYWENEQFSWLLGATLYNTSGHTTAYPKNTPRVDEVLKDYRETWYTLYSQAAYQATHDLKLIIGAQAVKPDGLTWSFVPRAGAIYQINSTMGVKALFSKAYRAAFEFENAMNAPPIVVGNPALAPETINTYDLQFFYQNQRTQWSLTYFNSRQKNLIAYTIGSDDFGSYINAGTLKQQGIELEAKFTPIDKLIILSSLSYQGNQQEHIKDYSTVPNWMAKVGLSYDFSPDLSVGLYDNYFSAAHDINVRSGITQYVNPPADAVHLMTLNLNLDIGHWLGVSQHNSLLLNGYVYNLLDEAVYSHEVVRGVLNTLPARQGRGIYLGLKYHF